MFHAPEQYRIVTGPQASSTIYGPNGAFAVPVNGRHLHIIASNGLGWEHVSVSHPKKTPSWSDMCAIKRLFWDADDTVMQLHPAERDYINLHPHCLHLWRPIGRAIPVPPRLLVGPRSNPNQGSNGMAAPPDTPDPRANNELIASLYQQLSKLHRLGIEHDGENLFDHRLLERDTERQANRWVEAARRPPQ